MVTIHRKSKLVQREFLETPLYGVLTRSAFRQDFMEMLSNIDFEITEFPAPDGFVELVAEVVVMPKAEYDQLVAFGREMAELYKANLDLQIEVLEAKKRG